MILNGYVAYNQTYANTWIIFSPNETGLPSLNGVSLPGGTVGFDYASFLMGRVDNGYAAIPTKTRMGSHGISGFVQDSWKVTRKLTLDYGLRYDFQTYLSEEHGRYGYLLAESRQIRAAGNLPGALIFEGYGGGRCNCRFAHNYPLAFGPRLGLAYQVTPEDGVSRRASAFPTTSRTTITAFRSPPDRSRFTRRRPMEIPLISCRTASLIRSPGRTSIPVKFRCPARRVRLRSCSIRTPAARRDNLQWSIGIQREIFADLLVEADLRGQSGSLVECAVPDQSQYPDAADSGCARAGYQQPRRSGSARAAHQLPDGDHARIRHPALSRVPVDCDGSPVHPAVPAVRQSRQLALFAGLAIRGMTRCRLR